MNLDIIQPTKESEITQFLCDVRDYFKASLTTSEYENTSNMFYVTASETTEKLLLRCEGLINRLNIKTQNGPTNAPASGQFLDATCVTDSFTKNENKYKEDMKPKRNEQNTEQEDGSYLDMSAAAYKHNTFKGSEGQLKSSDFKSLGKNNKEFRCSTFVVEQNKSFLHEKNDAVTSGDKDQLEDEVINKQGSDDERLEIVPDEKPNAKTSNTYFSLPHYDCPYMDLTAGHLSIYKSTKYGQLQKIEKRLFFDQSKKCYCGILNDWLLCYVDGPTSSKPTLSLYLKMPGIEVEHYGEGKRRDICFQISTCDTNKKFAFQAINEIDAKEWIHAIETVIRSDVSSLDAKKSVPRKLPTPPVIKNITFLSSFQRSYQLSSTNTTSDSIYEEPSVIQQSRDIKKTCSEQPPELPSKLHIYSSVNNRFEYDVPKCPAQPLESLTKFADNSQSDSNYLQPVQESNVETEQNLDFQTIVKDVHNKLSSQLSSVSNPKKPLKKSVTSLLKTDVDFSNNFYSSSSSPVNELKKQFKITSNTNSQKASNEKSSFSKNWLLNKINKSNSSTRSNSSSPSNSPTKCKQSEKENLLNSSSDACDCYEVSGINLTSNPVSPTLKTISPKNGTSKVNMIINQLEAGKHLASKFRTDITCDNDSNNYEPIMTVSMPIN